MDIVLEAIMDDYYCNLRTITKEYYDELYDYIEEKGPKNVNIDKINEEMNRYHTEKMKKFQEFTGEISKKMIGN